MLYLILWNRKQINDTILISSPSTYLFAHPFASLSTK